MWISWPHKLHFTTQLEKDIQKCAEDWFKKEQTPLMSINRTKLQLIMLKKPDITKLQNYSILN